MMTVGNLCKTFPYPSPEEYARYVFGLPPKKAPIRVLENLNFKLKAGEVLGVLGRNGAGKSTLLRVLAGLHEKDPGSVIECKGGVAAIFEMGVTSNKYQSGREYCRRYFRFIGHGPDELPRLEREVAEFSGLGRFFDEPINSYSAGMRARLFFSVLMNHEEAEILLLDEILSVGDELFRKKSYRRLMRLVSEGGKACVFATHDWLSALRMCDRLMILDKGKIEYIGLAGEAACRYAERLPTVSCNRARARIANAERLCSTAVEFDPGCEFRLRIEVEAAECVPMAVSCCFEIPRRGLILLISRSRQLFAGSGKWIVEFCIPKMPICDGCILSLGICEPWKKGEASTRCIYDLLSWTVRRGIRLVPREKPASGGLVLLSHRWEFER